MGFDYRIYTELGQQSLGGHKQNFVCTRTQEKGVVTPQETGPDLPVTVQSLQLRCGSVVAYCRVGGTEYSSECMGPFAGGRYYLHYLHHSLVSGPTTGREHSPAHQQNPTTNAPYLPSISLLSRNTWVTHNKCLRFFPPVSMVTKHVCFSVFPRI